MLKQLKLPFCQKPVLTILPRGNKWIVECNGVYFCGGTVWNQDVDLATKFHLPARAKECVLENLEFSRSDFYYWERPYNEYIYHFILHGVFVVSDNTGTTVHDKYGRKMNENGALGKNDFIFPSIEVAMMVWRRIRKQLSKEDIEFREN